MSNVYHYLFILLSAFLQKRHIRVDGGCWCTARQGCRVLQPLSSPILWSTPSWQWQTRTSTWGAAAQWCPQTWTSWASFWSSKGTSTPEWLLESWCLNLMVWKHKFEDGWEVEMWKRRADTWCIAAVCWALVHFQYCETWQKTGCFICLNNMIIFQ